MCCNTMLVVLSTRATYGAKLSVWHKKSPNYNNILCFFENKSFEVTECISIGEVKVRYGSGDGS